MPKSKLNNNSKRKKNSRYIKKTFGKSVFDGNPTLILNHYRVPKSYQAAVADVLTAFRSGIPFNRAVDQVYTLDLLHINRDKLAEHTLKFIANDY